jgi:hypothetical protein
MNEVKDEAQTNQEAPPRIIVKSSPPVSVHAGPFEFRMMSRKLEGQMEDHGGTLEVYGVVDGRSQEVLKFDCFAEGPHWHRCYPDKPDLITQLGSVGADQALQFAVETLRTRFGGLIAEQGFAPLSPETEGPELAAALSAVEGAMTQLIRRDPATL